MITNGPQYSLLGRGGLGERFGLHAVLAFFSTRILRGGPRILLNLATCLVVLILITKMMPSRMTDIALGPAYNSIWRGGSSTEKEDAIIGDDLGGGLRIVVFGESDIGTPSPADGGVNGTLLSWTEMLCAELGCSKHLSFIPPADPQHSAMTSNSFYAAAVERVLNDTADSDLPALDYTFVPDLFPVKWEVPDLATQVTRFLATEKPTEKPPAETIWVFSLGPWDIWSLAALPISVGKSITDIITADIFTHVERIYAASRDENSIAYSDFFDESASSESYGENTTDRSVRYRGEYPTVRPTIEPFRIIIPKVFDPSVLPGWWDSRPPTASIHSKAEQMKHAAELTEYWNDNLHNGLAEWILTGWEDLEKGKKNQPEKEKEEDKPKQPERKRPQSAKKPTPNKEKTKSGKQRRSTTASATQSGASEAAEPAEPRRALRDGIAYDMPDYILTVMADRQLRNSDLKDSNGLGEGTSEDTFLEVWTPCIQPANPVPFNRVDPSDLTINVKHYDEPKKDKPKEKPAEKPADKQKEESKEQSSEKPKELQNKRPEKQSEKPKEEPKEETKEETKEDPKGKSEQEDENETVDEDEEEIVEEEETEEPGEESSDGKEDSNTQGSPTRKQRRAAIPAPAEGTYAPGLPKVNTTELQQSVAERICPEPNDHLFHTSFTLSQRAIGYIAKELADMVRFNETVRRQWSRIGKDPADDGDEHH